ncbi:MAG: hypothetical protein A3J06_02890 [Candidatus Moranbacteria bacterium RIFCSPLOWO2_02_FULL_48_19]|nr:MAG: hypothetical protein A3J06_02890 [Candidatus Moranbacteria bacterium RIFCSPLOWO2_02_FULL_48_19]OGI29889.1 MAG: hypothetical protein A3G09_04785 [Candidatus Moranbacteria bacterium RIFCSPLOWO2_12_FULL_48_12]
MPQDFSSEMSQQEHSLSSAYGEVLLHWQAPEHEPLELGPRSRIIVTVLLIAIIAYALYTDSPLMAITFILIGVVGYLSLYREPRILSFFVTARGIIAGSEFYEYDTLQSFFIYTDPPFENILSIQTAGKLVPYVHIPAMTVDINVLRDTLDEFIPEEKHDPGLVDTLEKLLHI